MRQHYSSVHPQNQFLFKQTRFKPILALLPTKRKAALFVLFFPLLYILGCETEDSTVIDSVGSPPSLSSASILPSTINTDTINIGSVRSPDDVLELKPVVTVKATHASGNHSISSVEYFIRQEVGTSSIGSGNLADDGVAPDQTKGDGIFSGRAAFKIKRVELGVFKVELIAKSVQGYQSNGVILPLTIYRGNKPPVISNVQAPDTVTLASQTQFLTLRARADDPDGKEDVVRVIFNSYKPDSSASSGNPFQMYDDGNAANGDETKGDKVYSLVIQLPPTTQTGTYRFEFQAFDRSNEGSNTIVHRMTVRP